MQISNMKTTKFHSLVDWVGELKNSPKIWLNYEGNFLNIICARKNTNTPTYMRVKEYMINVNDVAYVDVAY